MKIFSQEHILYKSISFFGKKIKFENLTKRTNNILFKIEHLIHLTEKWFFNFFLVCLTKFMYMVKKLIFSIYMSEFENNG